MVATVSLPLALRQTELPSAECDRARANDYLLSTRSQAPDFRAQ